MMKDKLNQEVLSDSKAFNQKTQFVSLSLATRKVNSINTKPNSFRQKGAVKFKTTKSSPEKNLLKQEENPFLHQSQKAKHLNEKIKQKAEMNVIGNDDNPDDFMKKKLLKKKQEAKAKSNYLNFTNPVYQINNNNHNAHIENSREKTASPDGKDIATPASKSINTSLNKLNQTKNSGQQIVGNDNIQQIPLGSGNGSNDQEKASIHTNVTSSVASPRELSMKPKQSNNIKIASQKRLSSNSKYATSGVKQIQCQNIIGSNKNNLSRPMTSNINAIELINSKATWQTTPVTKQNSRKTSNDKKITQFPIKKNTILSNISNPKPNIFPHSNQLNNNEEKNMPVKPMTSKLPKEFNTAATGSLSLIPQKKPVLDKKVNSYSKNVLSYITHTSKPHLTTGNSPTHFHMNFNKLQCQSNIPAECINNSSTQLKKSSNTSVAQSAHNEKCKQNISTSVQKNDNLPIKTTNTILSPTGNNIISNQSNGIVKGMSKKIMSMKYTMKKPNFTASNSKEVFEKFMNDNSIPTALKSKKNTSAMRTPKELAEPKINSNIPHIIPKAPNKITIPKSNKPIPTIPKEEDNKESLASIDIPQAHHNDSFEFNQSLCSMKSTVHDGANFMKESQKMRSEIISYYKKKKDYPSTKLSFYKFGRLIGHGAFGKVNLGLHILTGRMVAIKSFNKANLTKDQSHSKIFHEINLMKSLRHHSIVKIFETLETEKYILIIMENIAGGDLLTFVKKRSKLNEKTAKLIFRQLMEAIKFIHSAGVIHRDIKLDNILIDLNNNIKLCDFGVGKMVRKNEVLTDQCGTPAYIAPEILHNQGYEGAPVDLWSSGVVLYAMLSGAVPFKASNIEELHTLILKGSYPAVPDITPEATHLIMSLLEIDPRKRITVDKVLNHPWMNNAIEDVSNQKLVLFTKAEMVLLSKANVDYCNGSKEDLIEHFTLRNLDTKNDMENQNISTKSLILAPFTSSVEDNNNSEDDDYLLPQIKIQNKVMKFSNKAKELNRNYELNNNGEIDHGILINHSSDEIALPVNNNPPVILGNAENINVSFDKDNNDKDSFGNEMHNNNNNKISNNPKQINEDFISNHDSQRNKSSKDSSSLTNANTFSIDENILKRVEELSYNKEYVQKALMNNDLNYATATYYILLHAMLYGCLK